MSGRAGTGATAGGVTSALGGAGESGTTSGGALAPALVPDDSIEGVETDSGATVETLSDLAIRQAKATGKAYTLPDLDGLSLAVTAAGGRTWHFRYCWAGKQKRKIGRAHV